jgi:hypothetical protein
VLNVSAATIAMDTTSLQNLMNRHVFAYADAPLEDLEVGTDGDHLTLKGTLHKGIDVPFSSKSTVGISDDGRLELHVDSMKTAGIPSKGLLKLFGLELDDVIDLKARRGVEVRENDILIDPAHVLPPPEIRGRLTGARLVNGKLVQFMGDAKPTDRSARQSKGRPRNYVSFKSGVIRFGKLTMTDADLQLIDADPKDPFDFFPAQYERQLVAGYSKSTAQRGLRTYMPDYDDLGRRRSTTNAGKGTPSGRRD